MTPSQPPERLAKILARAGVCSRREAEKLILAGRVTVEGVPILTPAFVITAQASITVDGKPLPSCEAPRLWRYHKPRGLLTTHRDPQGRATVFESLPPTLPRVISVGRLDMDSEGLLLLTNDGGFSRLLELPKMGWKRVYRVRIFGQIQASLLHSLTQGITVEGVTYSPIHAVQDTEKSEASNTWLTVTLTEGKNREIRRVMAHFGWSVNRLIRVAYGPFTLGKLPPRGIEEILSPLTSIQERVFL